MKATIISVSVGILLLACGIQASAEEPALGESEYLQSCASCHGKAGEGDGFLAPYLKSPPPSLTGLTASNGGVFPMQRVYSVIDGTSTVGVHGGRNMPVWGGRYSAQAREELKSFLLGFDERQEEFVRIRILALVEYISTLQMK